jgi:hypothetical protein
MFNKNRPQASQGRLNGDPFPDGRHFIEKSIQGIENNDFIVSANVPIPRARAKIN